MIAPILWGYCGGLRIGLLAVVVVVDGVVVGVADEGLRDVGHRIGHYASCVVVP